VGVLLVLAAGLSACRVRVDKDARGEEKNVQVDTPFGGVHVNTDKTTAADVGLPLYPGATAATDKDKDKSVDVHMGFGEWQLRVRAASFESADTQDKVLAFYKQELAKYGDVITCEANAPVGKPTITSQGLTCNDNDNHGKVKIDQGDYSLDKGNLELKAGSKRHQHIVGFKPPNAGRTRFALVALDLPANTGKDSN
jgi:hypothetical protein